MTISKNKIIDIIGAQIDLGASRRGVAMGPNAIRYSGLIEKIEKLGYSCCDKGDVSPNSTKISEPNSKLKNLEAVNSVNEKIYKHVHESLLNQHFPIVLGGDHSIAAGSILGVQSVYNNIGIIWIDAHGDFNNENTSPSGNLHGMPLSACTGNGPNRMVPFKPDNIAFVNPKKIALIGIRELDMKEKNALLESGVNVFTMSDIDQHGMRDVMEAAIEVVEKDTNGFHLSFDLDGIDPNYAPGVGTPVHGGLTFREAHLAVEMLAQREKLLSSEFVELNPIIDESNKTGKLTVHLIQSLLGQTIF